MLFRVLLVAVIALAASACAGTGDKRIAASNPLRPGDLDRRAQRLNVEELYSSAREALDSADYSTALALYTRIDAQYPFAPEATQGKLESIYAHFKSFEPELALAAADRFLRAHPRHAHIDYVYYLRGLINFERAGSDLMDVLGMDSATRDTINERHAFEDFATLLQRFPTSVYVTDARQRMVYLRNRIARHDYAIASYYLERGAWVAASRRGLEILAQYQGSAVIPDTLKLLATSYREMGLPDRADEMQAILQTSYPPASAADDATDDDDEAATNAEPPAMQAAM